MVTKMTEVRIVVKMKVMMMTEDDGSEKDAGIEDSDGGGKDG